jgi:hypothetical protein
MAQMLALFKEEEAAANATERLEQEGFTDEQVEILTDSPYPEGAFGEKEVKHKLYVFPFIGALLGLSVAILLTFATQTAYPMVTGGKPILSIPPMLIISYEGMMMGAILFTVVGIFFESRIPNLSAGIYDPRITEGYIGITVNVPEDKTGSVQQIMRDAGAEEVLEKGS